MKIIHASWWSSVTLLCATLNVNSYADDTQWINARLKEFERDPQAFAENSIHWTKYDARTLQPTQVKQKFTKEDILSGAFVQEKDQIRMKIIDKEGREGRAEILSNDNPYNLVDDLKYTRLDEIASAGLTKGNARVAPWTDDYWPLYTGVIAKRYPDQNFPEDKRWNVNANYIRSFFSPDACDTSLRSPAEKYDLLVGDHNFTLSKQMLARGESYFRNHGKVETWMGICHGWAPASYMLPRPSSYVDTRAADGVTPIRFYPSDIKALASLLWADSSPTSRFIGGRCNQSKPATDQYGRIQSQECFDTNPATWHLALVNQVGHSQRTMVFDATYDYEVWNQPVYSYEYTYFNPITRQAVSSLNEATVDRRYFNNDVYASHRSAKTAYVVGISMKVVYVAEKSAEVEDHNSIEDDKWVAVRYFYDLEIDRNGKIIGGEWYQQNHPDFLWTYEEGARALSQGDFDLVRSEKWTGRRSVPNEWQRAARKSSRAGQPLARIVESLIELSNQ
jgi:hypothetical protein